MTLFFFRRLFVKDDPMIVFGTPTDVNVDAKMSWNVLQTFNLIPPLAGKVNVISEDHKIFKKSPTLDSTRLKFKRYFELCYIVQK